MEINQILEKVNQTYEEIKPIVAELKENLDREIKEAPSHAKLATNIFDNQIVSNPNNAVMTVVKTIDTQTLEQTTVQNKLVHTDV